MQYPKHLDKNIRFLITANYHRMMSFEHAAFLTSEPSFKKFYFEKAEESEINIKQLSIMLNLGNPASTRVSDIENHHVDKFVANLFHGKKSTIRILESVKTIEKTIGKRYKTTLKEVKDLPQEMLELIKTQYKLLTTAQLQMEYL